MDKGVEASVQVKEFSKEWKLLKNGSCSLGRSVPVEWTKKSLRYCPSYLSSPFTASALYPALEVPLMYGSLIFPWFLCVQMQRDHSSPGSQQPFVCLPILLCITYCESPRPPRCCIPDNSVSGSSANVTMYSGSTIVFREEKGRRKHQ